MSQGFYGFPNILGLLRCTNLKVLGKAGAVAGAGLAGGTTSGAPTSGAFDQGDLVVGQDGTLWICTAAGSPGTFAQVTGTAGAAGANFTVGSIPAVRCYNSGNQSIPATTLTALTFDSNRYDAGTGTAQHSTSSNTSRLVCQTAGIYHIGAQVQWAGSASGVRRHSRLRLNGTTVIAETEQQVSSASAAPYQIVSTHYKLAVSDYVEVLVFHDASGALNVNAEANSTNELMWALIG